MCSNFVSLHKFYKEISAPYTFNVFVLRELSVTMSIMAFSTKNQSSKFLRYFVCAKSSWQQEDSHVLSDHVHNYVIQ